ncbi:protein rIIB [Vibrio phage VH7D]|uniref:Protein rIIB n=1 Tax=Vibrio phage VH7D TaxID=1262539 RepID=V9LYQ9_9CAUD|nr:RIIB lysis inhibitor [Vibrio phage VH7D]AGB06819.1 protein rIIB [Vibrio phage VH7D]QBX06328.1 protein rIIB [Vibrio phage Va3]QNJ54571.1 protein rIIB [Vibrio phage vB_ValM_R10Z]QNJ54956.1 protein rIIB [Vibrio phage vB_ValM_R11Z]
MVNLPLETKQSIVKASANGMTQKDNAAKHGTSPTTLRRVLAEHRDGKFSLNTAKQVVKRPRRKQHCQDVFKENLEKLLDTTGTKEPTPKTKAPEPEKTLDQKLDEAIEEFAYVITPVNVSFTVDGQAYSADITAPNYSKIVEALLDNDGATAVELLDVAKGIEEFMLGNVKVKGGVVKYKDLDIDGGMTGRILEAMEDGDKTQVTKLVKFFENLIENPSRRAVEELYGFLEAADIELTDDGHFLAYKKIRDNYKDIHSNKMCNKPGTRVWMLRHQVNDNKDQTCSAGLHVCSKGYLPHFGGAAGNRVVLCKVNPRDVVSVPSDYNNTKLRCSEYLVLKELDKNTLK